MVALNTDFLDEAKKFQLEARNNKNYPAYVYYTQIVNKIEKMEIIAFPSFNVFFGTLEYKSWEEKYRSEIEFVENFDKEPYSRKVFNV